VKLTTSSGIIVAAVPVGILAPFLAELLASPRVLLTVGALVAMSGVWAGVRRTRREIGRVDFFHPLILPNGYVAVSFLAPAWMMVVGRESYLGFTPSQFAPHTAGLMMLAVTGFTLGAAIPWSVSSQPPRSRRKPEARMVLHLGRLILFVPAFIEARDFLQDAVLTRGIAQTSYGLESSVSALVRIAAPVATVLILNSHRQRAGRFFAPVDWVLVLGTCALFGLNGHRSAAIGMLLCVLYAYTRERPGKLVTGLGLTATATAAVAVVAYRNLARGGRAQEPIDAIITDWSVATYTTGITAAYIPQNEPYQWGVSVLDALIRQLPSVVVNPLLGPPADTGVHTFRRLIGYSNPNQGFGYSVPAEGYLNFGAVGVFGFCFVFAALLALAYTRRSWPATGAVALAYPLLLGPFPVNVRTDVLGAVKGGLYPLLIAASVYAIGRSVSHTTRSDRRKRRGCDVSGHR
jgi:hypothetical protein